MAFEHYLRSGNRLLRCGYTTGTCAALAAAGAARLLLTGSCPDSAAMVLPNGHSVSAPLLDAAIDPGGETARCAVCKDAGDDPDVTDGILVCAAVSRTPEGVFIDGGEGVGRVTKPGLDQPVGAAAINRVPREMIRDAVLQVSAQAGYSGGLSVVISVPGGAELAEKTMNPALGVVGGISILGTSGMVLPMSDQALLDTIALELRQARTEGNRLILTPGNYGADFLASMLPELAQTLPVVKCANFLGDAIDMALLEGFSRVLLVGHAGKLIKLAGGIFQTHSRVADCRRELFCAHAALQGAPQAVCRALMEQVTADGCIAVLEEAGLRETVFQSLLSAIKTHLDRRAEGQAEIGALVFSNVYGCLGMTPNAAGWVAGRSDFGSGIGRKQEEKQ